MIWPIFLSVAAGGAVALIAWEVTKYAMATRMVRLLSRQLLISAAIRSYVDGDPTWTQIAKVTVERGPAWESEKKS